jgi:hypothetical protein
MYFVFPAIRRVTQEDRDAAAPEADAHAQNGTATQASANGPRDAHSATR